MVYLALKEDTECENVGSLPVLIFLFNAAALLIASRHLYRKLYKIVIYSDPPL